MKELFLNDLLLNFITDQFGIGSGVIVDAYGNESKQTDIIVYDKRILPPIIKNSNLGTYPLESVLAIIEVKSTISRKVIEDIETKFKYLDDNLVYLRKIQNLKDQDTKVNLNIVKGLIGFNRNSIREIKDGKVDWLNEKIHHIDAICHVQKYSWIKWSSNKKWKYRQKDSQTFEETKRFIAWILDVARSKSNKRQNILGRKYIPWLSSYIRNQADPQQDE